MTRRGLFALCLAASALCSGARGQSVDFTLNETMTVREAEVGYVLDLTLSVVEPTRLGIDVLLDLRDFQRQLPLRLTGRPVLDVCGSRTVLGDLSTEAEGRVVSVAGTVGSTFFRCERTGEGSFQRGEIRQEAELSFTGAFSARIEENCVVFEIEDLTLRPLRNPVDQEEANRNIERAKTLLLEAVDLVLVETPFCPALPEQFASLDPIYESGEPREVDEGGLGVALRGSIDVSTSTILDILGVLQTEGVLPGPP